MKTNKIIIGLADADLLDGGTRHPNLTLLKIAGFLYDNSIKFELIENSDTNINKYYRIYLSKVFTFTKLPHFLTFSKNIRRNKKFIIGGTGFYANETNIRNFIELRNKDMQILEEDKFLCQFPNKRGGKNKMGINMANQMPYYHLYDNYITNKIKAGRKESYYKDYLKYSIGFLTRGCFRHCPFCVNKLEKNILPYSKLESFLDNERDDTGKLIRPYIYLWDDNFLAASRDIWYPILQELIKTKRPFQFRQGLDERIIAESPYGEEIASLLSKCRYHGDYIFAFDNWKDRDKIETALKIWKKYNKKETKFYLFCGYKLTPLNDDKLYQDIWEIFHRIKILMNYGCLGYIMRHEDYHNHPLNNIYIQIARWCNQPQFYKKMSFWEFCYRNQTYWEEKTGRYKIEKKLKSYEEFIEDYNSGMYKDRKLCLPLRSIMAIMNKFPDHKAELLEMFNYKLKNLINPSLWEEK